MVTSERESLSRIQREASPKNSVRPVKCSSNSKFSHCASLCPPTCKKRDVAFAAICVDGCICDEGFILDGEKGKCIPKKECCNNTCGTNECCTDCVIPCNDCKTRGKCEFFACIPGCDCIKGYFKNKKGVCIPECDCPGKGKTPPKCGKNQKYYKCMPNCHHTCETYGMKGPCPDYCISGCGCRKGYVLRKDGLCVKPSKCQKRPDCGKNEVIVDCAKPAWCNTCRIKGDCKLKSCCKGCDCKKGYYRNNKSVCIPQSRCPSKNV